MKGFRSIKNECKIELKSTNYKILSKPNVSNTGILKGFLLVGPGGCGKSNIQYGLKLLLDLLFTDTKVDYRNYFCLSDKDKTISLHYHFLVRSCRIHYHIEVEYGKPMHVNERLYINDELWCERTDNTGRYISEVNPVRALHIDENELFVRELYKRNVFIPNKVLSEWMNELSNSMYVNVQEQKIQSYMKDTASLDLEKSVPEINRFFATNNIPYVVSIKNDLGRVSYRLSKNDGLALPLTMESNSIRFLIRVLPAYLHVIEKGGLLILDEFHLFHPLFAKLLISYFESNSKAGQIIISTTSTALLNAGVLRADQLYAVNDLGEGTFVLRFSEKQPRELQNMEKMYYNNIFGGLPQL
ncbi:MAG: ATP-binding protein [Erysipelotrichales bacterium]|nr:ATP-binding protein [Erysipelotrichales bacterium]